MTKEIEVKSVEFLEEAIGNSLAADAGNERKKGAELVWADNCPIDQQAVTALRSYDRNYGLAFQKAAGKDVINTLNGKPEVGYARAYADVGGVEFGVEVARHQDPKATAEQKAAGIALTTRVQVANEAQRTLLDLAGLMK